MGSTHRSIPRDISDKLYFLTSLPRPLTDEFRTQPLSQCSLYSSMFFLSKLRLQEQNKKDLNVDTILVAIHVTCLFIKQPNNIVLRCVLSTKLLELVM